MNERETWLQKAIIKLQVPFYLAGHEIPEKVRISCGLPSKRAFTAKSKVIGQCWPPAASADGHHELFISPTISESIMVLETVAHELCHAIAGTEAGHKLPFKRVWQSVGFEGRPKGPDNAGPILREKLEGIVMSLGEYPHGALNPLMSPIKKQGTRMIKVFCPACDYTVRTTEKWIMVGLPTCVCGEEMTQEEKEDGE